MNKLNANKTNKICYICCEVGADTKDHIIPKCFFVPSFPDNLLTLPAHYRCQNQLWEEYLRNIAVALSGRSVSAKTLWDDKVARSFERNRPLRDSLRSSLLKRVDLVSPGGIWLGSTPGIRVNTNHFYPPLEKIVRGLYRHYTGRFLPKDAAFDWAINEPLEGQRLKIFQSSKPGISYPGVFECRFGVASEGNIEMTVWWLRFYEGLVMRCVTKIGTTEGTNQKST
jgi:hypothetical protein